MSKRKKSNQNKAKAFQLLKSKIYEETIKEKEEKEDSERRSKIGSGDRSEKIRTITIHKIE